MLLNFAWQQDWEQSDYQNPKVREQIDLFEQLLNTLKNTKDLKELKAILKLESIKETGQYSKLQEKISSKATVKLDDCVFELVDQEVNEKLKIVDTATQKASIKNDTNCYKDPESYFLK